MNQDDLKEMRKDITALIDDIKYHSDSLTDLERLPVIQLKVILAKINKLTEKSTILLHYVEKEGKLSDKYSEAASNIEENLTDNKVEENTPLDQSNPVEDKKQEIENPPLAEKNEQGSKSDLNKLVIKDIFSAIGINEKYLFASILFKGSTSLLKEEVLVLNNTESLKKAKDHLNQLGEKYNWDQENETVQNFYTLIERKFDQF